MQYVITFVLASCFFVLAGRAKNKCLVFRTHRAYRIHISTIYATIGVIVLSILAGLRGPSVGVDVKTYVLTSWDRILRCESIKEVIDNHYMEVGYELLEYFISRFTSDVHCLHFATSLIVGAGVCRFSKSFEEKNSFAMSMFVFMCMYYNQSLNAIRQWLAIGIYMYGVQYLLKKKPVQYFIVSVVAMLFHSSAVITIPIYFIYHFLKGENKHRKRSMLILSATVIAVIFFDKICLTMIGMGILPMKYAHYFTEAEGTSSLVMQVLSRVPLLLGCFILRKQLQIYDEKAYIWIVFLMIDLLVGMLGASFGYASRCSLYFGVWQCMFMSEVYVVLRKRIQPTGRMFVTVGVDGMLLLYWYYCYVVRTFSLTYPYVSDVISWIN